MRNMQSWYYFVWRHSLVFTVDFPNYSPKQHFLSSFFAFLVISWNCWCHFISQRAWVSLLESGASRRSFRARTARGGEEGEGFEWGRLRAGALGPYATRGLIWGRGSPGNQVSPLLSCGTIALCGTPASGFRSPVHPAQALQKCDYK